jgi:hypothetical protein
LPFTGLAAAGKRGAALETACGDLNVFVVSNTLRFGDLAPTFLTAKDEIR